MNRDQHALGLGNGFGSPGRTFPIAIAGMHRSGTSMVAALMHRCGVFVGAERDLMQAAPDNEDGYWENVRFVALDEEILRAAGGGWDDPPTASALEAADLTKVRDRALALVSELNVRSPWGFKDPRITLTLPFWVQVIPGIRVIGCVRNPLEVALSLRRRNDLSYERSLKLWLHYNRCLLRSVPRSQLVLTHYDAYFTDPISELMRVLHECRLTVGRHVLRQASIAVRSDLHHNRFSASDLIKANVSGEVRMLYQELCGLASWPIEVVDNESRPAGQPIDREILDAVFNRSAPTPRTPATARQSRTQSPEDVTAAGSVPVGRQPASERLESLEVEARRLGDALSKARTLLKRSKAEVAQMAERDEGVRQASTILEKEVVSLREKVTHRTAAEEASHALSLRQEMIIEAMRVKIQRLKRELATRPVQQAQQDPSSGAEAAVRQIQASLDDTVTRLRRSAERLDRAAGGSSGVPGRLSYTESRDRLGEALTECVPVGATVLIASKGDDSLLKILGRRGWHYPRSEDGSYSWFYPADSGSAVAQLEALRADGADYIAFPAHSQWWMTHYTGFRRHLERHYRKVFEEKEIGLVFALRESPGDPRATKRVIADVVRRIADAGPSPSVLDWTRTAELSTEFSEEIIFSPLQSAPPLPYVDDSADVVVVRQADRATLNEARRIASTAVVKVNGSGVADVEWLDRTPAFESTVAIVLACDRSSHTTARSLDALVETVPATDAVTFVLVGVTEVDSLQSAIAELRRRGQSVLPIGPTARGKVPAALNRAARKLRSELLVFVRASAIPVHGWFQPLVRTLVADDTVGVSGGKVVLPDGRLMAAGGAVFSDCGWVDLGRFEQRVDAPVFNHARQVDYCVGSVLATRRKLFWQLGGFDTSLRSGVDVDYCLRVWESGHSVVYQPDCVVVQSTSGESELESDPDPIFRSKWQRQLKSRPYPPARFDMHAWLELAVREPRHRYET